MAGLPAILSVSESANQLGPTVDGVHIPASPYQLLAEGKVRKVPFIIGNTKDE
jgi:carboxylesterase type B